MKLFARMDKEVEITREQLEILVKASTSDYFSDDYYKGSQLCEKLFKGSGYVPGDGIEILAIESGLHKDEYKCRYSDIEF